MKKLSFILFVFVAFSFTGCEDKSGGDVTTLLSFTAGEAYYGLDENWIVVQSEDGTLLEYKKFEPGDAFTLQTTKKVRGNTMGVTILKDKLDGDIRIFQLVTSLNLNIGMDVKLGPFVPAVDAGGAVTGSFSFTVEDCALLGNAVMSNKFGRTCDAWESSPAEQKVTATCDAVANTDKYIFQVVDDSGNMKYKVLEGVVPGGVYTSAYSELSDFDQVVDFNFPTTGVVFCSVDAREAGQPNEQNGFNLNTRYPTSPLSNIKMGYLNSLPNPKTFLFLNYPT